MKRTTRLRKMLSEKEIIVAPGVYSPLPAMIAENVGFSAVYMSGYTTAAFILGLPDVGLITMTEMALNARRISEAVSIPVIADMDNGYGNAVNVMRAVREYENAGVAAIQMEDQLTPKKCGHMAGKAIVSAEEMVQKIKAARDALQDKDLVIIARTDARNVLGFDEAIKRGNMYAEAGADVVFIESPVNEEEVAAIPKLINAPVFSNMVEKGMTPLYTNQKLQDMGYSIVIWPGSSAWSTAKAVEETMLELKEKGTTEALIREKMIAWADFNGLIKAPEYQKLNEKYKC